MVLGCMRCLHNYACVLTRTFFPPPPLPARAPKIRRASAMEAGSSSEDGSSFPGVPASWMNAASEQEHKKIEDNLFEAISEAGLPSNILGSSGKTPSTPPAAQPHPPTPLTQMFEGMGVTSQGLSSDVPQEVLSVQEQLQQRAAGLLKPAETAPTEEEIQLRACVEDGVDIRSKWGQKFSRSDAAKSEEYKNANNKQKQQFRKDWANTKLKELSFKKEKLQSWQRVDKRAGVMVPFSVLWQREGGKDDPGALAAAIKYATRALQMGKGWASINPMTDRLEFNHIRREFQETFLECWSLYVTENQGGKNPAIQNNTQEEEKEETPAETAGSETPKKPAVPKGKGRAKAKAFIGGSKGGKSPKDSDKDGGEHRKKPRTKTPLEEAIAEANAVKTGLNQAQTTAQAILAATSTDAAWKWANNEAMLKPLKDALQDVNNKISTFGRTFLTTEMKMLKKEFPDKDLATELCNFTSSLRDPVEDLEKEGKILLSMHRSRKIA